MKVFLGVALWAALLLCGPLLGQEVTVINNFPGGSRSEPSDFVLNRVTEHTIQINEYAVPEGSPKAQVMQMIRHALRAYTDNQYYSQRNAVFCTEKGDEFSKATAAIVRNALWINDYDFYNSFSTFSPEVLRRANALHDLSGYRLYGKDEPQKNGSGSSRDKQQRSIDLYSFQRAVYDLKITMEQEVAQFLELNYKDEAPTLYEAYGNPNRPQLENFEHKLEPLIGLDADLAALKPNLPVDFSRQPSSQGKRRKKRNDEFNERVMKLLEDNNRILANYGMRFDVVQSQINAERGERSDGLALVREEVKALRELVQATLGGVSAPTGDVGGGQMVQVIFEKNAHSLSSAHMANLNRIVGAMQRNVQLRANVIGYADRTGPSEYNALLSSLRADAVRDYLVGQGIAPGRIGVSYVGDSASTSPNPADRRVEVSLR